MPSVIHETFREALHQEIWRWIKELAARNDNVGIFARGMADTEGAPSYKFPPTINPESEDGSEANAAVDVDTIQASNTPDIPFRHEEDALPGTIIEVAYSQASKDLRKLAYTYLVHSNAAVQVVFGFELKHGSARRATFSIWRSRDDGETLSMVTECYGRVCDYPLFMFHPSLLNYPRNSVILMENLQRMTPYASDYKTLPWMTLRKRFWVVMTRSSTSPWINSATFYQERRIRQSIER
jgi:hypothetical protein